MEDWIKHVYIIVLKGKYPLEDIDIVQTEHMTYAAYRPSRTGWGSILSIKDYINKRNGLLK